MVVVVLPSEPVTATISQGQKSVSYTHLAGEFLPRLAQRLGPDRIAKGLHPVELRLDKRAAAIIAGTPAGEKDFDTEFLDYRCV